MAARPRHQRRNSLIPNTLYHYTDGKGKDAILKTQTIKRSHIRNGDASFGSGVYLTSMSPFRNTREKIVRNNWQSGFRKNVMKSTYVFKLKVKGKKLRSYKDGDRDVYVFRNDDLKLELLEDWTLYEWTAEKPKEIDSGRFNIFSILFESDSDSD